MGIAWRGLEMQDQDYDRYTPPVGFCAFCGQPCEAIQIDDGVGVVEWGGRFVNDVRLVWVSPCCLDEVLSEIT